VGEKRNYRVAANSRNGENSRLSMELGPAPRRREVRIPDSYSNIHPLKSKSLRKVIHDEKEKNLVSSGTGNSPRKREHQRAFRLRNGGGGERRMQARYAGETQNDAEAASIVRKEAPLRQGALRRGTAWKHE